MRFKSLIISAIVIILILLMGFSIFNTKNKEEKFWDWFEKNQEAYYDGVENLEIRERLFDDLSNNLKKVEEGLVFEFSPMHDDGTREFTISADGIKELFPAVRKLVAKAPKLKNWKFNAFRQRIPGNEFQIKYGDLEIGYDDIYFRSENDNGKVGLELYIRDYDGEGGSQSAIYILLDALIGEYDVTTKIGWIEWNKLEESDKDDLQPIIELRTIVDN